jgi:hypothetical protein
MSRPPSERLFDGRLDPTMYLLSAYLIAEFRYRRTGDKIGIVPSEAVSLQLGTYT